MTMAVLVMVMFDREFCQLSEFSIKTGTGEEIISLLIRIFVGRWHCVHCQCLYGITSFHMTCIYEVTP
jgi:hypothetical protein